MSVSYRAAALALYNNRRHYFYQTFPWPNMDTTVDTGVGAGGSNCITVYTNNEFRIAWNSAGVAGGSLPPPGWTAQPTLTGAESWWPHGYHSYGRATCSPNYGYILSGCQGLRQNGGVGIMHACYWYPYANDANTANSWAYLAPSSGPEGEKGANAWNFHLGFDYRLRKDLVVMGIDGDIRLRVQSINGVYPNVPTLGPLVWEGTPSEYTAGYRFYYVQNPGGDRFNLPWVGKWWVLDLANTVFGAPKIWGFSSLTPSNPIFDVPIANGVAARMTGGFRANLAMAVDHVNQRVIAGQADITEAPDASLRYPLILWDVNPDTFVWTPITFSGAPPLRVRAPGEANIHNPFHHAGGFQFNWWDRDGNNDASSHYGIVSGSNNLKFSTGGHVWSQIYVPTTPAPPRSVTLHEWTFNSAGVITGEWCRQKHVSYAQRGADGRIYSHGGDCGGVGAGSYNQIIVSFDPEDPASFLIEQPEAITGKAFRPFHPDENGWEWLASRGEFWMSYMYAGSFTAFTDFDSRAEWESLTGGSFSRAWRWNPSTKIWTNNAITPAAGFEWATWKQGDGVGGRWYHDPGADTMVAICFNTDSCITVMKCSDYTFRQYPATRLHDGATTLPDGRDPYAIMGAKGRWYCGDDRAAMDPATGMLYFWNSYTGDVYRCDTRAASYPYQGVQYLPITWCCRLPCTYETRNLTHFMWAKGALWVLSVGRLYSWAPGESRAWEHDLPVHVMGTACCVYTKGGDQRLLFFGSDGPYTYLQRHTGISSRDKTWYTLELSV